MTLRDAMAEGEAAQALALRALAFLAEDPERLGRFLALSGMGPAELRTRASDPVLLGAITCSPTSGCSSPSRTRTG
jgi:hypothetical protein